MHFARHAVAFAEWTMTGGNLPLWKDPRDSKIHAMRARGDIPYDVRVKQRLLSRLWDPIGVELAKLGLPHDRLQR